MRTRRIGKPHKIYIGNGLNSIDKPVLSVPCFEGRHEDCNHQDIFGRDIKCECKCHHFTASNPFSSRIELVKDLTKEKSNSSHG